MDWFETCPFITVREAPVKLLFRH